MTYQYVWNVLEYEGGFSDRAADRGGATFRGITWKTYLVYCKKANIVAAKWHHRNLHEEEVLAIYLMLFAEPAGIEKYTSIWVREAMFSACIMHGQGSATKMAQRAAKSGLKLDGIPGPKTRHVINLSPDIAFVNSLTAERIVLVSRLVQRTIKRGDTSQAKNLVGWSNRLLRFIHPVIGKSEENV